MAVLTRFKNFIHPGGPIKGKTGDIIDIHEPATEIKPPVKYCISPSCANKSSSDPSEREHQTFADVLLCPAQECWQSQSF